MNDKELGNPLDRRSFLKSATGAAALVATSTALPQQQTSSSPVSQSGPTGTGQRIPVISPKDYTPEQHQLYKTLDASIQKYLQGFVTSRSDGALIGPFNILLRFPQLGTAIWNLFTVLAESTALPSLAREVVILATQSRSADSTIDLQRGREDIRGAGYGRNGYHRRLLHRDLRPA